MASILAARASNEVSRSAHTSRTPLTDATDHVTTAIVATGATDYADIREHERVSINVVNGATEDCDFTVEGSLDGTNWSTVAYGSGSSSAYTQASKNVAISGDEILFLPPDDYLSFVRVNISDANATAGTTFTVYGG
jgi:hypothetical protein